MALMPQIGLVIAVGGHAHRWHLGGDNAKSVEQTVMAWRIHAAREQPVFALPHPSWRNSGWLKRNPWFEVELLPALQAAVLSQLN